MRTFLSQTGQAVRDQLEQALFSLPPGDAEIRILERQIIAAIALAMEMESDELSQPTAGAVSVRADRSLPGQPFRPRSIERALPTTENSLHPKSSQAI